MLKGDFDLSEFTYGLKVIPPAFCCQVWRTQSNGLCLGTARFDLWAFCGNWALPGFGLRRHINTSCCVAGAHLNQPHRVL